MKKLLIVAACVVFVLFLSLGVVAACVVSGASAVNFGFGQSEKASREETRPLVLASGKLLDVEVRAGTIRVTATTEGSPSLSAKLTAFGGTQKKADEALAELKLDVQDTAEGVRVRILGEERKSRSILGGISIGCGAEADLEIRVPPGVRLDVRSSSGDVQAEGPFAESKVHSSYGAVKVRAVEGDLDVTSSSGDVAVRGAKGKKVVVKSSYGNVHLADCESSETEVSSSSGELELENVRGERIRVACSYGGVTVKRVSGSLEVKSSSGDVKIRDCEGPLVAHSSYGAVDVAGVFPALELSSSSGDVTARAKPGSRVDGEWKLTSSYGGVTLLVPDGFGCHLDAKTSYGAISVGLPLEADAGTKKRNSHTVRGNLNGGGGTVEVRCSSGDVKVEAGGK